MPSPSATNRRLVIASVMASMFVIAIEATIVSTAMPQIAGQLGGLHLYAWVFSSFLLTQTATTVVFGKLSDLYGRRPVLLFGIAVFVVASIFCGLATSMPGMIVFRLMQGVGAGAIQPVGMTVVGDLYTAEERGRVQGWLASIWAISAVLGPLVGGLIIQNLSWAWIFWINVPIGLLAAAGFLAFFHESIAPKSRSVDWIGAALFTTLVAALMVALTEIGTSDWTAASWAAGVVLVALVLFLLQERRAADPMIALGLWAHRAIAAANGASLLAGVALIGLTTFLPMYVQGVLRQSPLVAGFALTVMVLGWPAGATTAAKLLVRVGLRPILVCGSALIPLGAVVFILLGPGSSPVTAGIGSMIMGFGMGLLSTASLVMVQELVDWAQRGSATASNLFSRNLGSTLGAAALGAILNYGLGHGAGLAPITSDELRSLLDHGALATSPAAEAVRNVLQDSLHLTFWGVFLVSAATLAVALLVPAVALRRPAGEIEKALVEEVAL